jgi:hypothetical protein
MISRHASDTSSIKSKPPINLSPSKIGLLHYFSESCYNIGWVPLAVVVMIQGTECRISHISTSNHPHSRSSTARPPNEGSPRNLIGNINEHGTLNTAEISPPLYHHYPIFIAGRWPTTQLHLKNHRQRQRNLQNTVIPGEILLSRVDYPHRGDTCPPSFPRISQFHPILSSLAYIYPGQPLELSSRDADEDPAVEKIA